MEILAVDIEDGISAGIWRFWPLTSKMASRLAAVLGAMRMRAAASEVAIRVIGRLFKATSNVWFDRESRNRGRHYFDLRFLKVIE
jgi:hypothetical protein